MFKSPISAKERILAYGGAGAGKSAAAFHIAQFYDQTGTEGKIRIADTDSAAERMYEAGYKNLNNIEIIPIYSWEDLQPLSKLTYGPNDWLVVDFISASWQFVQDWYADQVFDHDMAIQIMFTRTKIEEQNRLNTKEKTPTALDAWRDWPAINGIYSTWLNTLFARNRVHILGTAPAKEAGDRTPPQTLSLIKSIGLLPAGQKDLLHAFHTVLYFNKVNRDYVFTTVKDREREGVNSKPMIRFPMSYLQEIAGWQITE